jgi:hypothetical protein
LRRPAHRFLDLLDYGPIQDVIRWIDLDQVSSEWYICSPKMPQLLKSS